MKNVFLSSLVLLVSSMANASLPLSPQIVVDMVLKSSDQAQIITKQRESQWVEKARILARYDYIFELSTDYMYTEAETLQGFQNESTQELSYLLGFRKKFSGGGDLDLSYKAIGQNNDLATFNLSRGQASRQFMDVLELNYEQNLIRNSFGIVDRLEILNAELNQNKHEFERSEATEELILNTMEMFWQSFTAKETLEESFASRKRYQDLSRIVRNKKKVGYAAPAELPQTQAELIIQEQKVKTASLDYIRKSENLKRLLKLDPAKDLDFSVSELIPEPPKIEEKVISDLRKLKSKMIEIESLINQVKIAKSKAKPELKFIAKLSSTGVDTEAGEAFTELSSIAKPTYYAGLRFRFALGDNSRGAEVRHANANKKIMELELQKLKDQLTADLMSFQKEVQSSYSVAKSAVDLLKARERAAKEIKAAYRQGRLEVKQLIDAYNALSSAETNKIQSIGRYHMSLNQYSALRDELVQLTN
ncbi:MAG: TolC family protein [Bdellovibrionales bacterium]